MKQVTLNDGNTIPAVGFGVFLIPNDGPTYDAVLSALKAGYDYISDAATVSVHINRLREKIEDDARNPKVIETVWGAGYRLNA